MPLFEWFFRAAPIGHLVHGRQSSPDILSQITDYRTYIRTGGNLIDSKIAARTILKTRHLACYKAVQEFL